jgi:uncharacterized membrane protein YqhA
MMFTRQLFSRINYRSRWTWLSIYLALLMLCYFLLGAISAGMSLFGFVVGYTFSLID